MFPKLRPQLIQSWNSPSSFRRFHLRFPRLRTRPGSSPFISRDNLDFTDSRKALNTDFMEQNFVDYLSIFPAVMAEDRVEAFKTLIERSSAMPETRALIEALGKKYLNHPESPMRNDEYFADFVAASGR